MWLMMEPLSKPAGDPAPVRVIAPDRPMAWVARGWHDFLAEPWLGVLHGGAFLVGGLLIALIGWGRHDLLAGAFSGFLLVGPLLLGGLYAISRERQAGRSVRFATVTQGGREGSGAQWRLGVLLGLLGTLWVALSALIIVGWSGARGGGVLHFVRDFVVSPHWQPFALWLAAGGLFAALVFAISAVSVPMLLDRDVTVRCAVLTSVRAVGNNPEAMLLWAAIVMVTVLFALALLLPMLVMVPVLGHATWHAYRDLVDAGALPARH